MKKFLSKPILINPYFWMGLYLFFIIFFASIYTINNSHFYHSNIAREKDYYELSNNLEVEFEQELNSMVEKSNNENLSYLEIPNTNYAISVEDIEVIVYDPINVSFNVIVPLLDNRSINENSTSTFMVHNAIYNFQLTGTRFFMEDNTVLQNCLISPVNNLYNPLTSEEYENDVDITTILGGNNWNLSINISNEVDDMILTLLKSEDGYVDGYENNFFRMLYLSVVTITTLGFGDIAPITDFARFLIGLESILGVIILSLFINSLFHHITINAIKKDNSFK